MGKILLPSLVLLLILPTAVAVTTTDFSSQGGQFVGTNHGLELTGSTLVSVSGLPNLDQVVATNVGSVSFATGGLISGSLKFGGVFAGGGYYKATGNGTNGVPDALLFSGAFTKATWTLRTLNDGSHEYTLRGLMDGTLIGGLLKTGVPMKMVLNTGHDYFESEPLDGEGGGIIVGLPGPVGEPGLSPKPIQPPTPISMPEPPPLAMIAGALAGLAGLAGRRFRLRRSPRSQP